MQQEDDPKNLFGQTELMQKKVQYWWKKASSGTLYHSLWVMVHLCLCNVPYSHCLRWPGMLWKTAFWFLKLIFDMITHHLFNHLVLGFVNYQPKISLVLHRTQDSWSFMEIGIGKANPFVLRKFITGNDKAVCLHTQITAYENKRNRKGVSPQRQGAMIQVSPQYT